jgi:hypothetical protein
MKTLRPWFGGLIVGLIFSACTTLAFNYRYYVLNFESQTLQGKTANEDQPLEICKHDQSGYKCIVVPIDEFFRLKSDHLKQQIRIQELERECR